MGLQFKLRAAKRGIAWILIVALLFQVSPVYAQEVSQNTTGEAQVVETEEMEYEQESAVEVSGDAESVSDSSETMEESETDPSTTDLDENNQREESRAALFENGKIKIYNLKQLQAIGTGQAVTTEDMQEDTFGTGENIQENGQIVAYSLEANYELVNEILLDVNQLWTLPEGFTGNFSQTPKGYSRLYDAETDTIYIYNNYQLLLAVSENAEEEPVMSNDMIPEKIGMGQLLYKDGSPADDSMEAAQEYLTYSREHNYVLSPEFTEQMPELEAQAISSEQVWLEGEDAAGRTTPGQLYYEKDGKKYILIGNESQLRAIGSDKHVTPRLYVYHPSGVVGGLLGGKPSYTPYYPGDADLGLEKVAPEGGTTHKEGILPSKDVPDEITKDFYAYYKTKDGKDKTEAEKYELADVDLSNPNILSGILELLGGLLGTLLTGKSVICGVDENGRPNNDKADRLTLIQQYGDLKYSSDADYIIFRDIDLNAGGENSNKQDDKWTPLHFSGKMEGWENMVQGSATTISNVNVFQSGELNMETTSGIGFFGTISNKVDENTLNSAGEAMVKDIHLEQVNIVNESTTVADNVDSLVEGVLGLLGGLLGGVLDLLNPILGNLKLGDIVKGLLEVKKKSPDLFATGSFAGRIVGHVYIENCTVTNASVISAKGLSGGFVGYTEGTEQYDGLSGLLETVVKILSNLLNIIPGVGLGDLIKVLLENDVPLGQLIPSGYYNPKLTGCSVSLSTGEIGNKTQDYNGGFVGMQIGTIIENGSVSGLQSVQANNGAGGFAGVQRDAVINGLVNDLGVQLYTLDIRSKQENCTVAGDTIQIQAAESYAGGFNGLMANSISQNSAVNLLNSVKAKKYAGGFVGRATIGYGTAVGGTDQSKATLLNSVSKLLGDLVASGNTDELNTLLSLSGVTPSQIHGCTVAGNKLSVESTGDYAGGIIGQGDGIKITTANGVTFGVKVSGLLKVYADNYAGGIAGSVTTADAIGVINNIVGVGQYIPFEITDTTVEGTGLVVTAAKKYAAGAAGLMLGGEANRVTIQGIETIQAGNYAGGFAGRTGTSSLAAAGGLDILGLVKINNVLSLAQGMRVKITESVVTGTDAGLMVTADGTAELTDGEDFIAGGFLGEAVASEVEKSHVSQLKEVTAMRSEEKGSYAGGFVGRSHTGGLAGLAQEEEDGSLKLPGILEVDSLLNLVPYLIPKYTYTTVTFISNDEKPQVQAQLAGGFVGAMQSGTVDNSSQTDDFFAVYGLEQVKGESHAGGFAGKADAGATASSDGLNLLSGILKLDINDLLSVLNVYIPIIKSAGVKSAKKGFTVEATDKDSSAGGFIGYGSGVQISTSDVTSLRHTKVTPPNDSLESTDGSSYFGKNSSYAVKGGKYAGGYIGCVDIDSAAAVGGGLKLLGNIQVSNVLKALDTVASTIEDSNVNGCVGGFSVLADGTDKSDNLVGKAGGFAGEMAGTIIKRSNVNNFSYIIGREMAGGYAGVMEPGDVVAILEDGSVLDGLLNIGDSLASLVQSFIPIIEDSQTSSVPCGGAVRAEGLTDTQTVRGLAGGYVGYNHGGRITGTNTECAAIRIRSVYGGEFAGGFTGLMETADLKGTGNLKLLYGLVETSNVLSLLSAVYPAETNTAVYGPLRKLDMDTWNAWAEAVGNKGVYGYQFPAEKVESEEDLKALIKKYAYGYNVKAGRTVEGSQFMQAGIAGGYVGRMKAGVVTEAHAWDTKSVIAYKSAGGFAGEMLTGGVAEVGRVSLLGLPITGSISAVQTFVPVIRNSDITGFQSGLTVKSTGIPIKNSTVKIEKVGYAGGFVGHMLGGQIWGNWSEISTMSETDAVPDPNNDRCFVGNLRKVEGTNAVGGFAGRIDPASAASLDTASSEGLLGGLLQNLIKTPGDLLSLLNATVSTVCGADIKAWDNWGIVINGAYTNATGNTVYAKAAGGFAGEINGAVIGEKDKPENGVHLTDIRSVTGGEYAGGFFGLADVSAVVEVTGDGNTSILASLIGLGGTDVLDAFRTYIYDSSVAGTTDAGLEVRARDAKKQEYVNHPVYTGTGGGFGGSLLNGSVKNSTVTHLREVEGLNYTGGFIGHLGKSGVVDVDQLGLLHNLVQAGAGVLDVFGSHVDDSTVEGVAEGFTVKSNNTVGETDKSEIAGGFTGYADLAKMSGNQVKNLKQVASNETAGGFAGQTSCAYLADIKANSVLVNVLFKYLNTILQALWVADLQQGQVLKIDLGLLTVEALCDGDLVHIELFGLDIKIALAKEQQLATVYIGDSKIELNCGKDGSITNEDTVKDEINISLIKANRTKIDGCTVTGIADGYDVYGGGAGNKNNGSGDKGYAGGFVGRNDEGLLKNNQMYLADVIRGTKGKVGPFTGASSLESNWEFNTVFAIEGENNQYRIYREPDVAYTKLLKTDRTELQEAFEIDAAWNVYTIQHMAKGKVEKFTDLKDAVMSNGSQEKELLAYQEEGAMAILMKNTPTEPTKPGDKDEAPDVQDPCKELIKLRLKKVWKGDSEKERPEQVVFHITRSYEVNGQTIQDENFNEKIILSEKDALTKDVWEKVLSGEKYTAYHVGENGEKYYYTYHVTEDTLAGYETSIKYQGDYQYNITVTNKKNWFDQILPETGGFGIHWIYGIGILLLVAYGIMEYRKRRCQKSELL